MMPTHALVGLLFAVPTAWLAPPLAPAAAVGGYVGGTLPDVDLFFGSHRRTLHYPVLGWVLAVPATALAAVRPGPWTVGVAAFLSAASLHAAMDMFGAGDELRPWERGSDRGVYDHWRGRWIRPQYVIRYDGAPEDVALTAAAAVPSLLTLEGPLRALVVATVIGAIAYALVRRRVPDWLERLGA